MTADGTAGDDRPKVQRRWIARRPVWVRVFLITAIVLVGLLAATMVVGATGMGMRSGAGGHGSGGHGCGGQMQTADHTSGDHGSDHVRGGSHSGDANHTSSCPR